jgi:hypothetical protein
MPSPIYLRLTRTLATVVHCPCWPVAPRPLSPIVLAVAKALPSQSLTHSHCLVPPRSLSSCVLSRPPAHTCCSPCLVPFCVTPLRPSLSNKGKVGKVRRSQANHCFHASVFQSPRCIVHLVLRRQRLPKIGDVRYGPVTPTLHHNLLYLSAKLKIYTNATRLYASAW